MDGALAIAETANASKAHTHLRPTVEVQQAASNGPVAAAPAAGLRTLDVAGNGGRVGHGASCGSSAVLVPIRMLLLLGSVRVNSRMPHGLSSTAVTGRPAVARRPCQATTSSVMM